MSLHRCHHPILEIGSDEPYFVETCLCSARSKKQESKKVRTREGKDLECDVSVFSFVNTSSFALSSLPFQEAY